MQKFSSQKTLTAVMSRPEPPTTWQLASAHVESRVNLSVSRSIIVKLAQLIIGLAIAATIVIVLTRPNSEGARAAWNEFARFWHNDEISPLRIGLAQVFAT